MKSKHESNNKQSRSGLGRTGWSLLGGLMAVVLVVGGVLLVQGPSAAADITVYKSPTCGCCGKWIEHLEANGFSVQVKNRRDLRGVKQELGVQPELQACHTGVIDGYVIEGHVPAGDIRRLLAERPAVRGLAVPGMPVGSPGMEGPRPQRYKVLSFDQQGNVSTFSRH